MATNITSTQLDFENIKNNLKTYLSQQSEFEDYNFEASGLSNILDVLAHNTHYNGLIANFALNESFLNTAQLRSSVVSHAEALGYIPRSITSSIAYLNINVTITDSSRPSTITLPKYSIFTATVDDVSYDFYTLEAYTGTDDGAGVYTFSTGTSVNIPVVQGSLKTKTFYVGDTTDRQIYVIPDITLDTSTVTVNVYNSPTSSVFNAFTPLFEAISVDNTSRHYQLKEVPNGYYELTFSDGLSTGLAPETGNKIVVQYLSSKGAASNGASGFASTETITVNSVDYNLSITTNTASTGGESRESIESIRYNAPVAFASQNRLVTAEDYKTLILAKYASSITDCIAWGGQDNDPVEYGKVFISVKFADNVSDATKTSVKDSIKTNLIDPLSILTISQEFVDPEETFLECSTFFQFNPNKTNVTLRTTESNVNTIVNDYFTDNLKLFGASFRRSNVLKIIDDSSEAILNSRMEIKAQQRFTPTLSTSASYTLNFPIAIAGPDDVNHTVTSNQFVFNDVVCTIKNKLESNILQVVDADSNIQVNNVGTYTAATGKISIVGFAPTAISGGLTTIRISVTPANQSTIRPLRNYTLNIESDKSFVSGTVDFEKTQVAL